MGIAYVGIAGHIATTSEGDTVVTVEMDVAAGSLLLITTPAGYGQLPDQSTDGAGGVYQSLGNYYYLSNVVDSQGNAWGYAMDPLGDNAMGTMPLSLISTPLVNGVDTVTVTLVQDPSFPDRSDPAYVARILCFTGIVAFTPNNGMPITMVDPVFNTPFTYSGGFFTPNPGDLIPMPALVNPGLSFGGLNGAFQEAGNLDLFYGEFVAATTNTSWGAVSESLFIVSIAWDGTATPWDYYYTDANESSFPVPSAAPAAYGLSSDNGTLDFSGPVPWDGTWVDLGFDTLGATIESRYGYMIEPSPTPDNMAGPVIHATYDVADGSWGDSYDQVHGDSFPFADGTWAAPPVVPLGDPNIISQPVSFTLQFLEGIASGVAAGPGIYATVGGDAGVYSGTGTATPDDIGIAYTKTRAAIGAS